MKRERETTAAVATTCTPAPHSTRGKARLADVLRSRAAINNLKGRPTDVIAGILRPSPGWHRAEARTPRLIIIFREGSARGFY